MEAITFREIRESKKINVVHWICDHFIQLRQYNQNEINDYTHNTFTEFSEKERKAFAKCAYWLLGLYNANCELKWRQHYIQCCDNYSDVDQLIWEDLEVFKQFWEWYYFELKLFVQNSDELDLLISKYTVVKDDIYIPMPWIGFTPKSQKYYKDYCSFFIAEK